MKIRIFSILIVLTVLAVIAPPLIAAAGVRGPQGVEDGAKPCLARIAIAGAGEAGKLDAMGVDLVEVRPEEGFAMALATAAGLDALAKRGYACSVVERDADSILAPSRGGTLKRYHTFEQTEKILKETASAYPGICSLEVIGTSCEGRPIYAMNITAKNAPGRGERPACMITGLTHGREWITLEVPLALIGELTKGYAANGQIKKLVDSRDIWIVPVVNPDGLVYSQTRMTMWRKNRRVNADNSVGVDINRNYGYQWGDVDEGTFGGASSTYGANDNYHGTGPFSESCSAAVRDLALRERFRTALSFHSYGGLILYPFGYSRGAITPDEPKLFEMASAMSKFNRYKIKKISDYCPVMGVSDDWLYGAAGVLAFTIELGTQFVPFDDEVDMICASNVKASLYLIQKAGESNAYNHPDFSSPVGRAVENYARSASAAGKVPDVTELVNILSPANDPTGSKLDEFVSRVSALDASSARAFIRALRAVRDMLMRSVHAAADNDKHARAALEKVRAELERARAE